MSSVVIVTREIGRRAETLITPTSSSVLEGVELLLTNNLYSDTLKTAGVQQVDCSNLLDKGLKILQDDPFGLLNINLSSQTVDVSSYTYFLNFNISRYLSPYTIIFYYRLERHTRS